MGDNRGDKVRPIGNHVVPTHLHPCSWLLHPCSYNPLFFGGGFSAKPLGKYRPNGFMVSFIASDYGTPEIESIRE